MATARQGKRKNSLATSHATMRRHSVDPFDYLCGRLASDIKAGRHSKARELALELLPYVQPRLKQIDQRVEGTQQITFTIGGKDW